MRDPNRISVLPPFLIRDRVDVRGETRTQSVAAHSAGSYAELVHSADEGSLPPIIVFYDGTCALCHRSVQWLLDHDPYQRLRFAPLQGATAEARRRDGVELPASVDSVALLVRDNGTFTVYLRAQAFLQLFRIIDYRPFWVRLIEHLPRWLADFGYRVVARSRHILFGHARSCPWRSPAEQRRFLP